MCTSKHNYFRVTDVFKLSTHAGGRTLKLLNVQSIYWPVHPKFHYQLTYIKHRPLSPSFLSATHLLTHNASYICTLWPSICNIFSYFHSHCSMFHKSRMHSEITQTAQLYQNCRSHLHILGGRQVTYSKFHNVDPQFWNDL